MSYPIVVQRPQTSTLALVGFVLALIAWPVGLLVSIGALVDVRRNGRGGWGLAVAGVTIGALGTLLMVAIIVLAAATNAHNAGL